jgi:hypothetical protein
MKQQISGLNLTVMFFWGHAVAQLFEALLYKPENRGFDSQ